MKKKTIILLSIIILLFVSLTRLDPSGKIELMPNLEVQAYTGAHVVQVEYYKAYIWDDHDGGAGEWYFHLGVIGAGSGYAEQTGEISVDGARMVDFDDLFVAWVWLADMPTFFCSAWEDDGIFGTQAYSSIHVTVDLLAVTPNEWQYHTARDVDTTHYYTYRVLDEAPTINTVGGHLAGHRGDVCQLSATATDPDGDSISYEWAIDGVTDPSADTDTFVFQVEDELVEIGDHTISVRAKDALGLYSDWADSTFTTTNAPPELNPISGPDTCYRGDTVAFHVAGNDPDGDYPFYYEWYINGYLMLEGESQPTLTFIHTMESWSVGENTVSVKVYDALGAYTEVSKTYTTLNHAPAVNAITGPTSGYRGTTMHLTASASDPEGDDLTYEWKIDSTPFPGQTDSEFNEYIDYSSGNVGPHTVYVRVQDEIGDYSDWASIAFTTLNHAPTVSVVSGPTSGYRGQAYTFSATGSDAEGDGLTYEWYVDGTYASSGTSLTRTFGSGDALGSHEIKVRVKDAIGDYSGYSTLTFTLTELPNDPPTISEIMGPDSAYIGDTCTFSTSATDPDGDDMTINWYINGTSQTTGESFTYTFDIETAGDYLIQARAQDSKGASSNYANHAFTLNDLEKPFYCYFNVTYEDETYVVETCSNSTVTDLTFNQAIKRVRFNATGTTGTESFCNITIPAELLSGNFTIFMDDAELEEGVDYTIISNSTHNTISIDYEHSSHMIDVFGTSVIPDFPSCLFLPFAMSATLLSFIVRKRLKKHRDPN